MDAEEKEANCNWRPLRISWHVERSCAQGPRRVEPTTGVVKSDARRLLGDPTGKLDVSGKIRMHVYTTRMGL